VKLFIESSAGGVSPALALAGSEGEDPAVAEAPGEKACLGDHRFAGQQRWFDHVPLRACPMVMKIA